MSAGSYRCYTLTQAEGGWIVQADWYGEPARIFVKLADALACLEQAARKGFCCEHDDAGNPMREP